MRYPQVPVPSSGLGGVEDAGVDSLHSPLPPVPLHHEIDAADVEPVNLLDSIRGFAAQERAV